MQNFTTDNLMVAIDFGTSKICGVVGKKDESGNVEIIAYASDAPQGIKRGAVSNPEAAAHGLKRVLTCLQNNVITILNKGVPDDEKKSYEITGVYVGLNADKPDLKSNLQECFKISKHKINGIVLSPVATASAVLSEDEKEKGCAIIDFGAGTTSAAIYHEKKLRYSCVIPLGSKLITNDISDLSVPETTAERLKINHGSAMEEMAENLHIPVPTEDEEEGETVSTKLLAKIIETRIDEILDYVCDKVEKSGFADRAKSVVITGGGSQLHNLIEKLKQHLGLSVRIGIPNQKTSSGMDKKYLKAEYAQLIGLLIHADESCIKEKVAVQQAPVVEKTPETEKKTAKNKWDNLFGTLFTDKEFAKEEPADKENNNKK